MKKTYRSLLAFATLSVLTACDFLHVEKIGKSDVASYFSDVYALEAAIYGVSNLTYNLYDSYMLLYPEVAGDMVTFSSTNKEFIQQYNFTSLESEETTAVGYIWRYGYEVLLNLNEIIYFGPDLKKEYPELSSRIDNAVAQAYFLRALIHLDLSLCYAQHYTYTSDASHLGIAVMTRVPGLTEKISRSTMAETYRQIISDLETGLGLFSQDYAHDSYFPSPAACKALLARVYLYMGDNVNARECASDVISDYGISLEPYASYRDMFCTVDTPGEAIYRISGMNDSYKYWSMFDYNSPKMYPSQKLLAIFSEDADPDHPDVRQDLLRYNVEDTDYNGVNLKYTILQDVSDKDKHTDLIVLRLSEMYLVRAEANCRLGNLDDAADDIAEIQARATGRAKSEISLSYSGADELDSIIMRERIKELFLEGHRLFDITRRKENLVRDDATNSTVKSISYPDDRFILPIPLVELDANEYMQSNPVNDTQQ